MANGKKERKERKERKEGKKSYEVHKDRMESHPLSLPLSRLFFAFVSTLVKSLFLHLFLKCSYVMTNSCLSVRDLLFGSGSV